MHANNFNYAIHLPTYLPNWYKYVLLNVKYTYKYLVAIQIYLTVNHFLPPTGIFHAAGLWNFQSQVKIKG